MSAESVKVVSETVATKAKEERRGSMKLLPLLVKILSLPNLLEALFVRVVDFGCRRRRLLLRRWLVLLLKRIVDEAAVAATPQAKVSCVGHSCY